MKTKDLTKQQKKILQMIIDHQMASGEETCPTLKELGLMTDMSRQAAEYQLTQLALKDKLIISKRRFCKLT